jgi:AcrR family transcriptional regulator
MNDIVTAAPNTAPSRTRSGFRREAQLRKTLQDIILSDGFARLSVSEMAQRLGFSKRTIYALGPT